MTNSYSLGCGSSRNAYVIAK